MNTKIPQATLQGELIISGIKIPCAVLDDGTRILRERSVAKALGKKGGGAYWQRKKEEKGAHLPEYISAKKLDPFIDDDLRVILLNPITYKTKTGGVAQGLPANILTDICNVWLKARQKGALTENQQKTAYLAELLMRGFAQIGIIALVDEATGYQDFRSKKALQEILEKFISEGLRKWIKTFPDDFYKEMFRLKGWQYAPLSVKRPSIVGKLTNDLIYERLAPFVLEELKKRNPKTEKGYRKHKHFQWLSSDVGHPKLREHLIAVTTLMKASSTWNQFYRLIQRSLPKYEQTREMLLEDKNGTPI